MAHRTRIALVFISLVAAPGAARAQTPAPAAASPAAAPTPLVDGVASPAATIADLGFLKGSWSAPQGPSEVEEHWTAPKAGTMIGMNRTTRADRTVAFEFLRVVTRPDGLYYMASPGGRPPTPFKLSAVAKDRATFTNPSHDFPQTISYWRDGEKLCASVAGKMKGQDAKEEWCWSALR